MGLRFERPRRVEGAEDWERAWLQGVELSEAERAQLIWIVRLFSPQLSESQVFGATPRDLAHANGIAEVPIEWWDVVDEAGGAVVYQLWLYAADCGSLFAVGTTERIAPINRSAFYGEGWEGDAPGSLAEQLDAAQRVIRQAHRDSELAGVDFVNRD